MAGYARFRRARKSFGSRRGMRRSGGSRGSRYGYKKTGYRVKPRFATVGFVRDTEKKYADASLVSITWLPEMIKYQADLTSGSLTVQGVKYMSQFRRSTSDIIDSGTNLVSVVGAGAAATGRIGNKINAKWLDLVVTLEAAKSRVNQQGEQENVEGVVVNPG